MKVRTGLGNGLSGFMLLASVALGVCFILTAVMICHYWNSHSTGYQPVQKIAVRHFRAISWFIFSFRNALARSVVGLAEQKAVKKKMPGRPRTFHRTRDTILCSVSYVSRLFWFVTVSCGYIFLFNFFKTKFNFCSIKGSFEHLWKNGFSCRTESNSLFWNTQSI